MRRPIVIILGFIVLVFVVLILLFGLKGPEMPIQEVHKVISMSKFQQQVTPQTIPAIPTPANNSQQLGSVQQAIPALPQPGVAPVKPDGNVGQALPAAPVPSSPPPQGAAPTSLPMAAPAAPAQQSGVPLIIPQPSSIPANTIGQPATTPPQQAIPALPQPGAAPGNTIGIPAQR